MKKKIIVTGISGFLGWHFSKLTFEDVEITGIYNREKPNCNLRCEPFDLSVPSGLKRFSNFLKFEKPDALIHLAAMSNPNECERKEELSHKINVEAPDFLSKLSKELSFSFLFTSTDLVFCGKQAPYTETDKRQPLMLYGKHKKKAENLVLKNNPKAIIARLPLMYGMPGNDKGFLANWLKKLNRGEQVFAFTDEFRSPTSAITIAKFLIELVLQNAEGIWHLGGDERLSRYDFAIRAANFFNKNIEGIQASSRHLVQMPAARPADVSLNSRKAIKSGFSPKKPEQELKQIKRLMTDEE